MTQQEVARRLGLSRSAIVQIEAGNRDVSSLELKRLAYLFGRDIREFVAESCDEQDTLDALFRAHPDVAEQPQVVKKLRECMALGRELMNLERLLGIDRDITPLATYPPSMPQNRWDAIQQGERLAEAERCRLGLGTAPLPDLPALLEMQGVRTALVDLPASVSGLTLNDRDAAPLVIVNRIHPPLRRRFSFAHEYGHIIADRERLGLVNRPLKHDDLVEVRANSFAASFLMPHKGVQRFIAWLGKGKPSRAYAKIFDEQEVLSAEGRTEPGSQDVQLYDLVQMAHHFGTSRISALYRLRNLRLVTEREFDRLKALDESGKGRQIADLLGLPESDQEAARGTFQHRFLGLALEAYRRDKIAPSKLKALAAMVELSPADVDRLIECSGLDEDAAVSPHAR
ncbi:MAG: XRE family transcriptional regulator [Myxococcales bacterium]|nr:XRE family transcriptional regulator [Myxococcota bacterium]MDW8283240.1 XRE family transcriptional regulator [Myxococcales bacterium]